MYASTLIVAAFMAGLGIGSLLGGVAADRLSQKKALIGFAVAELAIAAFSLLSRQLYYDFLYQQLGAQQIGAPTLVAVLFGSLLWPTFFMGVSLPLLARAVTNSVGAAAANGRPALRHEHPRSRASGHLPRPGGYCRRPASIRAFASAR